MEPAYRALLRAERVSEPREGRGQRILALIEFKLTHGSLEHTAFPIRDWVVLRSENHVA